MAGVEGDRHDFGGEDANAGRQGAVQRAVEVGGGDGGFEGEGGDLGEGVDAGVGAAGALREDALAHGAVDGVGKQALEGGQIGLDLPAMVGGAVIGESEFPVRHALLQHGNTEERVVSCQFSVVIRTGGPLAIGRRCQGTEN